MRNSIGEEKGQPKPEAGTFAKSALHLDAAAISFGNSPDKGQAQASTLHFGFLGLR
jgi:hypothetical protein